MGNVDFVDAAPDAQPTMHASYGLTASVLWSLITAINLKLRSVMSIRHCRR
jgi:hypothetical protein